MEFMTKGLKKISHIWFSAFRHGLCWPFGLWLARNSLGQVLLPLLTEHTKQWWSYKLIALRLFGVVILHHPHFIFGKGKQQICPQIWLMIELWNLWMRRANIKFTLCFRSQHYKPEGRGFDSWWGQWDLSST
jgi:hypothetical protein